MRRLLSAINPSMLLIVMALTGAATGLVLSNLDLLPDDAAAWWPLAVLVPAAAWVLYALARRRPRGLLASSVWLGVGISLMLAAQNVAPLGGTLVGVTLITMGAGLLMRGLLLSRQPLP